MRPYKLHTLLIAILLGILGSLAVPHATLAQSSNSVVDEIVAVVGDKIILRSEVDGFVLGIMQQQKMPYTKQLWMEALNQLVNQKVLAVEARRDTTLIVTDDQVEQALQQRIDQLSAQVGGEPKLEEIYGKSVAQIKDELRPDFRDRILAEQFQSNKLRDIKVTPSEVRQWFERLPSDSLPTLPDLVRIAHIVRYPEITEKARREAMQIITVIRDSIVAGNATIEDYARKYSDDPGSAANGGRYQSSRLSDLAPEFAAVAARIPVGEVSQPFETSFGLHILRVNDRRGGVVDFNHILIAFNESDTDPTEAIHDLEVYRDSIVTQHVPFELIARRHSEEQMSAVRGGRVVDPVSLSRDLPLEALGPTWKRTIDELKEGEISQPEPVQLLDGKQAYHILLLQQRIPSHRVNIVTDYERIQQIALQDKQQRVLNKWIGDLRKDVYVDIRGKAEDLAASMG